MADDRIRYGMSVLAVVLVITLASVASFGEDQVGGQVPSANPQSQEDLVAAEMSLADQAEDRDSRVKHMRKALSYRPNHPDNIVIEYRIGIELSQRWDPKYPQQKPLRNKALTVFERIMSKYNHMDYYSQHPVDRSYSPQLLVPEAAILAACLQRGVKRDSTKAREHLVFAM